MPEQRQPTAAPPPSLAKLLSRGALGAILGVCLLATALYWHRQRDRLIEIDRAPRRTISFQLDINQADWPELTLLPEVGESLAKRIVDSRETDGPFANHDDLRRVRGIGPKTLDRVRPYLLPMPDDGTLVETRLGGIAPAN
ncbi:MAG: helix-hairpin-helix domain-containing protein [Planctomycetales bacterium]|nr:helix-hairpin-helix domain-containing protein [Planctomycetales bacterium]